jgi:hypothetical protein
MAKCPQCGYERRPEDDAFGIVPAGECPRCGVIYAKAHGPGEAGRGDEPFSPGRARRVAEAERAPGGPAGTAREAGGKRVTAFILFALFLVAAVLAYPEVRRWLAGDWYADAGGLTNAYQEQRATGKPMLVFFRLPL